MTDTIFIDAVEGAKVAVFKGAGNQIGAASTPKMLAYILDTHNIQVRLSTVVQWILQMKLVSQLMMVRKS